MPSRPDRPGPTPVPSAPRPSDADIDELQTLLDRIPAPLEPLDVSMLDGFLCGVLVQPRKVPAGQWLPHVTDADGRALPPGFEIDRLHTLAQRRYTELNDSIVRRQWFDPWVFELAGPAHEQPHADEDDDDAPQALDAVYPWVAGFATALELFPQLIQGGSQALTEPLALLYRHLDPDDLEDADDLIAEIESLEPPADLSEAVEGLVRATLLLADVGRPLQQDPSRAPSRAPARAGSSPSRPGSARRPPPNRR